MIDSFTDEYQVLSNFSYTPVFFEGQYFPTSEHAFQAAKTFDTAEREYIASLPTPRNAKKAGLQVDLRSDWEDVKYDIMVEILYNKFSSNPYAYNVLMSTGSEKLVEGNTWHDNCWGDCHCPSCAGIAGENLLGQALMQVRGELLNS